MANNNVDHKFCIDFSPFVKAIKNVQKHIRILTNKHVSYGRAPKIGPGTDI